MNPTIKLLYYLFLLEEIKFNYEKDEEANQQMFDALRELPKAARQSRINGTSIFYQDSEYKRGGIVYEELIKYLLRKLYE